MQPSWQSHLVGGSALVLCTLGAIAWMRHLPRPQVHPLVFAKPEDQGPDLLEKQSKQLAGPNSVDCGRVGIGADPKSATACALAAQKAGKPFRVRYDLQGFDSAVAVAIVRTSIGTVGMLNYDSDPSGRGRLGGGVIYPKRCPEPVHLWVNPSGRINCFQQASAPPKDIMAPNMEPY